MNTAFDALLRDRELGGRYAIREAIGRGGMSIVYRAVDERLGREVALKIIATPATEHSREELRERFRREAAAAARIPPHPNVVQIYDYGTDPELDLDYIVMELLRGADVKAVLRGPPLPLEQALRILREAARGLAAGHRVGIVHRDVKPANIFLTGERGIEGVKLLDFGIAKALEAATEEELTRTGQLPHSPAYASPEQLDPSRAPTAASDVYQLGLVAYELLSGERPFGPEEREQRRPGAPLPEKGRWPEVPPGVRGVIARALDVDPARRPADAAEFAEALGAGTGDRPGRPGRDAADATLLAEESIPRPLPASPPVPPPAPSTPADGRRGVPTPRLLQLLGAGLLVAFGLLLITRLGGDPEPDRGASEEVATESSAAAAAIDRARLDEEFRPLVREAYETLGEGTEGEAGAEAAAEVERVVIDVNQAWVQGELDRHLDHYAGRVDFYGEPRADRDFIERDRRAALERFSEREITLGRRAIELPEPDRARVLVEKEWSFTGGGDRHTGAGRQEYILELRDGRWRIVSEQMVETYRAEDTRG